MPQHVLYHDEEKIVLRNYKYEVYEYPEAPEDEPAEAVLKQEKKYLRKKATKSRETKARRMQRDKTSVVEGVEERLN